MAQISYENWKEHSDNTFNRDNSYSQQRIQYFSLRGDGQEAVVRFMHDSPNDFDVVGVHRITVGDKFRSVNCIGSQDDPSKDCPLCASGNARSYRFYIHLIEYVRGEDGQIVGIPKVWERSTSYINKFVNLINEYGPLSDVVFKVKRNGATGSKDTTYDILFANPNVYRPELYKKDTQAFANYKAIGTVVFNYNKDKLEEILSTQGDATKVVEQPKQGVETLRVDNVTINPYTPVETTQTQAQPSYEERRPRYYQAQENTQRPRRYE